MPNITTDRFSEKQAQINQRKADLSSHYPELWSKIIAEWSSSGAENRVWLMYSANYLFRTHNVRWAIDPLILNWRIKGAPQVDVAADLKDLSFVLLTHRHGDHLDLDLLSALRHLQIPWVVPEFLLATVTRKAALPCEQIIVPEPLKPIELSGIYILPFNGLHWETTPAGTKKGAPALGYLIEADGKRWLFPGDTRRYDVVQLPDFGSVDHLFAHLWLGRGCALMEEPPLLGAFCQFCLDLKPKRITLTHLNEFERDARDLWDESHVRQVCSKLQILESGIPLTCAQMGESVSL